MKSRIQLVNEPYLRQSEIQRLLGISYQDARKIYRRARQIDEEEIGTDWIVCSKVRAETVYRVTGQKESNVRKKIEKADGVADQSAEVR